MIFNKDDFEVSEVRHFQETEQEIVVNEGNDYDINILNKDVYKFLFDEVLEQSMKYIRLTFCPEEKEIYIHKGFPFNEYTISYNNDELKNVLTEVINDYNNKMEIE